VDRRVGLTGEQRPLNFDGENSLAAEGCEIRLQIAVASRVDEN
jgi:hypothetical protein